MYEKDNICFIVLEHFGTYIMPYMGKHVEQDCQKWM